MQNFIKKLSDLDIYLVLDNDNIKVQHNGNLTPELKGEIREQKAEIIAYLKSKVKTSNFKSIEKAPEMESYPLSSGQYRLWLIQNMDPTSSAYNMPAQLYLDDSYDIDVLKKAIMATVERHEILRTVFRNDEDEEIRQWILPIDEIQLDIKYFDYQKEENKQEKLQEYFDADKIIPFNLDQGPLFRITFIQLSQNEYVFFYNMHHIISDGWSSNVITNDILTCYNLIKEGKDTEIPLLPIQYKDYTYWQKQQLDSGAYNKHEAYWIDMFTGELPKLQLPSNKARPLYKTYEGHQLETYLTPEVAEKFRTVLKKNGGSLFMGLITVIKILIYKYSGEKDIIIGCPIAGRDHKDLENQIGFYLNMLAIRNEVNPAESFSEFFNQVKQNTLNAYKHQAYPFDELVQKLDLKRDVSRNPIFDISLAIDNADIVKVDAAQHTRNTIEITDLGETTAKHDILFKAREIGDTIILNVTYNSDVYDAYLMKQFTGHLVSLITKISENAETKIAEIEVLSEIEKNQLLIDFNTTNITYAEKTTILDLFEKQAEKTPDAVAIRGIDEIVTYKELHTLSNQFASHILERYEIVTNDIVGIHLSYSKWTLISILGILKAGATYLPIDTTIPDDRKSHMIQDSKVKVIITETSYLFDMDYFDGELFAIDVEQEFTELSEEEVTLPKINVNYTAYVIYTSGSTGLPKGVQITHASLFNYISWAKTYYRSETFNNYNFGLYTSLAFDLTVTSLFVPLVSGSELVIFDNNESINHTLGKYLTSGISCIKLTPAHINVINSLQLEAKEVNIEMAIVGGDALQSNHVKILQSLNPNIKIYNEYGPTEATVGSITKDIESAAEINIGKPIANTQIYILDEQLNLSPIGIIGELYIGGDCLAKGYLNREELTAEKFIKNPFYPEKYLYKTGDLGRWTPEGEIEYTGRGDDQVKIRGYRIEIGEIEQQLQQSLYIEDAVVLVSTTEEEEKELVAFIVAKEKLKGNTLREELQKSLPMYMIPTRFIQLDKIPLTQNGKIDKQYLEDYKGEEISSGIEYVAATTKQEKILVAVMEEVLKKEAVSTEENFYNLGGDSIKSIQIISKLKQHGYTLKVEEVLRNPIIKNLAELLKEEVRTIDQSAVTGNVQFTPIQHSFLQEAKVPNHYNQSVLLKSKVPIDVEVLEKSLAAITTHHDALRMRYTKQDNTWTQYNNDVSDDNYEVQFHDLTKFSNPLEEMEKLGQTIQSGINLANGPLCKAAIFRLADGDRLLLVIHHLVVDGVSWRNLLEDIALLYVGFKSGETHTLPMKTDSFQFWAAELNAYANSSKMKKEATYWKNICSKEIPEFHAELENDAEKTSKKRVLSISLEKTITEAITSKVHKVYHTEINDILLTGLGLALDDVFGLQKYVIKMEGHGREEIIDNIDISRTTGWFTSIYPFVLEVILGNVQQQIVHVKESLRSIPNKGIGYGILKHLSQVSLPEIKPSILFNYLGDFGGNITTNNNETIFEYASESAGNSMHPANGSDIPLEVSGMIISDELTMSIGFDNGQYSEEKIQQLLQEYKKQLTNIVEALIMEETSYITPSDLTYKGLTVEELNELNADNNVEDIYKLSPLQQGIYFVWLSNISSEIYFEQTYYKLNGVSFNMENVQLAYEKLIERHAILRTSFTSNHSEDSLQIVWKKAPIQFYHEDLTTKNFSSEERANYLDKVKKEDRSKGFNLEQPSQMRLHVLDFGKDGYEFIWSHHHVLMDGWCVSILINDFYQILNDITNGRPSQLTEPVKYANYIEWLDTLDNEKSLAYWKKYLSGYTETVQLPYTKQGFNLDDYEEKKEIVQISGDVFDKVSALCKELGITLNAFIQTAWGYLLSNYNHTNDSVFGLVVSGRPAEVSKVEEMIGLFINTIPVRLKYDKNETIKELLTKIHEQALETSQHQYLNFSQVKSQSEIGTDLIDHILVFKDYLVQELVTENDQNVFENSIVEDTQILERNNFQYNIEVIPSDIGIRLDINYNTYRFHESFIKSTLQHFKNIVTAFASSPDKKISEVSYLEIDEKEKILKSLSGVKLHTKNEETIIDLFEQQAMLTPDSLAVQFNEKEITYKELQEKSSAYAVYLEKEHQISKGDVIGIYLNHSDWTLVAILGILKAGAVFVPIEASLPDERKAFMVNDTNMKLLVTETNYMFELDFYDGNMTAIDVEFEASTFAEIVPTSTPKINDLAYIIYTSGSTGLPKGVQVAHSSLANYLAWSKETYLTKDLTNYNFGLFTSLSFDLTITSIFLPILSGGKLNVYNDTDDIGQILIKYMSSETSCIKLTPAHISLMSALSPEAINTNIEMAIVGGDALQSTHVETLQKLNPNIRIYNEYGPTEATVGCIVKEITNANNITIGKPIANTEIYILDENEKLMPKGISGEICISGTALAKGYINRTELTAEKFIKNPFKQDEYLYKTGDLAVQKENGEIQYLGRVDNQVKINGFRIELGEIEENIQAIETIQSTIVIAQKTTEDQLKLIAYFTAKQEENIEEIKEALGQKLPEYMIPIYFVQLKEMPLTTNGKIDKKQLPNPASGALLSHVDYVAPVNDDETRMTNIIHQLVGIPVDKISTIANFFDLGINSLELMKMQHMIRTEFQIEIHITTLFEHTTIKDLVANTFNKQEELEEVNISDAIDDTLDELF
ncbi:amino acid adenylation domain-containing protein [Kordia sp.]|uniref:amino acid adenylation domain-containing protein n=1 Tax=Kordia sp. TaxID=1965332 RepID=UPI003B5C0AAC